MNFNNSKLILTIREWDSKGLKPFGGVWGRAPKKKGGYWIAALNNFSS